MRTAAVVSDCFKTPGPQGFNQPSILFQTIFYIHAVLSANADRRIKEGIISGLAHINPKKYALVFECAVGFEFEPLY
jgi:hypothetical protein